MTLQLNDSTIAVSRDASSGCWWMKQSAPTFLPPDFSLPLPMLERLAAPGCAALVDLTELEGAPDDGASAVLPEVSTGLPYLMIPVRGEAALNAVRMGPGGAEACAALKELMRDEETHPLKLISSLYFFYVVRPGDGTYGGVEPAAGGGGGGGATSAKTLVRSRMFCFEQGVWVEDAATGSAAGCLACHLARQGKHPLPGRILQGVEMGRPSTIDMDASESIKEVGGTTGPVWNVRVGGRVVPVASGTWGS